MGHKVKDLTGMRFGRLTVIKFAGINKTGRADFLCRCDCGTEKVIASADLTHKGHPVRSCGCLRQETKIKPGDRFERLTVIERSQPKVSPSGQVHVRWLCLCDCGNKVTVAGNDLASGYTKSCGCLHREKVKELYTDGTAPCKLHEADKPRSTNTSGVTGVWYDKSRQMWCAELMFRRKKYHIGRFKDKDDAIAARKDAEERIFKKYLETQNQRDE